jgi:hypothetical protein
MENRWRPDGFDEYDIASELLDDEEIVIPDKLEMSIATKLVRAGANAMLAAMRKRGIHSDMFYKEDTKDKLYFVTIQGKKGTLVFIPDDE